LICRVNGFVVCRRKFIEYNAIAYNPNLHSAVVAESMDHKGTVMPMIHIPEIGAEKRYRFSDASDMQFGTGFW